MIVYFGSFVWKIKISEIVTLERSCILARSYTSSPNPIVVVIVIFDGATVIPNRIFYTFISNEFLIHWARLKSVFAVVFWLTLTIFCPCVGVRTSTFVGIGPTGWNCWILVRITPSPIWLVAKSIRSFVVAAVVSVHALVFDKDGVVTLSVTQSITIMAHSFWNTFDSNNTSNASH